MIATLLTVLLLQLADLDGIAALQTTATVTLDRKIIDSGRLCLIRINETVPEGLPSTYIDCWLVGGDDRTVYKRSVLFISRGVWSVWVQVMGQDRKGHMTSYITPVIEVVTK